MTKKRPRGRRDYITELSKSSLINLAFVAQNTSVKFTSMLTLTYGQIYPSDGEILNQSRNRFLTMMRKKFKPFSYLWFLEFQKRGAPHLHVLLAVFPALKQRQEVGRLWVDAAIDFAIIDKSHEVEHIAKVKAKMIAVHTHPGRGAKRACWELIYSEDGAARYVTMYASKPHQKQVPSQYARVGRFWGHSRDVKPRILFTQDATEDEIRRHLAREGNPVSEWETLPKKIFKRSDKL